MTVEGAWITIFISLPLLVAVWLVLCGIIFVLGRDMLSWLRDPTSGWPAPTMSMIVIVAAVCALFLLTLTCPAWRAIAFLFGGA